MEDEDITSNAYQLIQPVWAESRASVYTILESGVQARLSASGTDWISCMYLAQYPCLPFCGLIYTQLIHLRCIGR